MKKISIIGGGFYGCYFAWKIKEDFQHYDVTIYEKNSDILLEAASNNQHRLHLGYHYPRSEETIEETIRNVRRFEEDFDQCLSTLENNFYLVHKSGEVSFSDYIKIYDKYELNHKIVDKNSLSSYIKDLDNIDGVINTGEKCINLQKAADLIKEKLKLNNVKILLNKDINSEDIENLGDTILNTTYTNPNLGLKTDKFILKYELCIIPVVKNFWKKNMAMTIMDGPFVSIYPDGLGNLTLSSVKYTPFQKYENSKDFFDHYVRLKDQDLIQEYNLLISDVKQHFIINNLDNIKIYKTPKIKLKNDTNDNRCSHIIREDNVISFLNGKLSSVCELYETLKEFL